jgi:hypothetical protein
MAGIIGGAGPFSFGAAVIVLLFVACACGQRLLPWAARQPLMIGQSGPAPGRRAGARW